MPGTTMLFTLAHNFFSPFVVTVNLSCRVNKAKVEFCFTFSIILTKYYVTDLTYIHFLSNLIMFSNLHVLVFFSLVCLIPYTLPMQFICAPLFVV